MWNNPEHHTHTEEPLHPAHLVMWSDQGVAMTPHSQISNLLLLHRGRTLAGCCHGDGATAGREAGGGDWAVVWLMQPAGGGWCGWCRWEDNQSRLINQSIKLTGQKWLISFSSNRILMIFVFQILSVFFSQNKWRRHRELWEFYGSNDQLLKYLKCINNSCYCHTADRLLYICHFAASPSTCLMLCWSDKTLQWLFALLV